MRAWVIQHRVSGDHFLALVHGGDVIGLGKEARRFDDFGDIRDLDFDDVPRVRPPIKIDREWKSQWIVIRREGGSNERGA